MGVLHAFQCRAHGTFDQRVDVSNGVKIPKCPHGCSKSFVSLVFVQAPGHIRPGTKRADRLVREACDMQKISDLSLSPSRSGGTVAERNRAKAMLGRKASGVPEAAKARAATFGEYMGALTHKENALTGLGMGNAHNPAEWKKDPETGKVKHAGPVGPIEPRPPGTVERVRR